jgi:hypothetical protein
VVQEPFLLRREYKYRQGSHIVFFNSVFFKPFSLCGLYISVEHIAKASGKTSTQNAAQVAKYPVLPGLYKALEIQDFRASGALYVFHFTVHCRPSS